MRCAVLGAGAWGTALADLLVRNGHDVKLWAFEPDVVESINGRHENSRFLAGHQLALRQTDALHDFTGVTARNSAATHDERARMLPACHRARVEGPRRTGPRRSASTDRSVTCENVKTCTRLYSIFLIMCLECIVCIIHIV